MNFLKYICTLSLLCLAIWPNDLLSQNSYSGNYLIAPFDLLSVTVYQEPDLTREVRVEADGSIVLPLINKVKVGKKTVGEAQALIRELYEKDYLVSAQVNLLVTERVVTQVQVLGQVNRPGVVLIPPDKPLTLLDAIAGANGFTRLANKRNVRLTTTSRTGEKTTKTINVEKLIESDNPDQDNIELKDGDTLFIDERFL